MGHHRSCSHLLPNYRGMLQNTAYFYTQPAFDCVTYENIQCSAPVAMVPYMRHKKNIHRLVINMSLGPCFVLSVPLFSVAPFGMGAAHIPCFLRCGCSRFQSEKLIAALRQGR